MADHLMGQLQSPSIVLFPVLGFCCGALAPSHHPFISEGWNKNAACPVCVVHGQSLTNAYQNEALVYEWGVRAGEGLHPGAEEKGVLHLFPDPPGFWPFVSLLTEGVCLTKQAGKCWHTLPSFLIGSSNEEKCWGTFFPPPQHSRFSGKYFS